MEFWLCGDDMFSRVARRLTDKCPAMWLFCSIPLQTFSALELNYRIALAVLSPYMVVEEIARFAKHVYYDVRLDVVYVFF